MYVNRELSRTLLHGLWRCIRLPVLTVLILVEPAVVFVCAAVTVIGLFTAAFFALFGPPSFSAWPVLGISLGFVVALVVYEALLRILYR